MSKIYIGTIISNNEIVTETYKMDIDIEGAEFFDEIIPGQFVNLYTGDGAMLLPRPISVCRADNGILTLVYRINGKGTERIALFEEGKKIGIFGPLGNGYETGACGDGINAVLVGGGIGIPPLIELAEELKSMGAGVTAIMGFQSQPFLIDEMREHADHIMIATDDGLYGFHGNVIELMEAEGIRGDIIYGCGPKPMLRALADYGNRKCIPVQVSMEERMGCGYGACVGCSIKVKGDDGSSVVQKKVCKDGPVFWGNEVIWDA